MRQIGTTVHLDESVDSVLTALADPAYHRQRGSSGAALHSATSAAIRDGFVRVQRAESYSPTVLPPMAARLVGDRLRLVLDEQVPVLADSDGVHEGRWRVTVEGIGIRAEGTLRLSGVGGRSTVEVRGRVEATNLLMAGVMEPAAATVAEQLFLDEGAALAAWLAAGS